MAAPRWQGFYTLQTVSRLTLINEATLRRWQRQGIIAPSMVVQDDRGKVIDRGYSFADVIVVKLIRAIREDHYDFATAAAALWHLRDRLGSPNAWNEANVFFLDRYVFAEKPDGWDVTEATRRGQVAMPALFGDDFDALRAKDPGELLVPAAFREFVVIDPAVMSGEPVIRGSRVPTSLMAGLRHKGHSLASIARAYHMLPRKLIAKAIEYEDYVERALQANAPPAGREARHYTAAPA